MLRPVGPEAPGVYWVRRGMVLVIASTVVFGGWWFLGGRASPGSAGAATDTEVVASAESVESAPSVDEGGTALVEDAPETEGDVLDQDPQECANSAIEVGATTDSTTYRVGSEDPVLTLSITNIGDVACLRDVGPLANELEITSGGYHVWSSDDCPLSDESDVKLLEPGVPTLNTVTWNGRLSQKGCPNDGNGKKAKAGRYEVIGRNIDNFSDGTPFALSNRES